MSKMPKIKETLRSIFLIKLIRRRQTIILAHFFMAET